MLMDEMVPTGRAFLPVGNGDRLITKQKTTASSFARWIPYRHRLVRLLFSVTLCTAIRASPHDIQSLLEQVLACKTDPTLWRRLGKLQLDAGEYAEARRIFCQGSKFCPLDDSLLHHVKVWDVFHSDDTQSTACGATLQPLQMPTSNNIFLSINVPDVPTSVQMWRGSCPPLERTTLVHASREPILSRAACKFLIDEAILVAKKRGWTTDRHKQAPTCDIPAHDLTPDAQVWIRQAFHNVLFPLISSAFINQLDLKDLRIQDCFVVRYDGNNSGPGFAALKPHEDESLISLTIALNDMHEYEGGGLFIKSTGDLLNGDAGTIMCFTGGLLHGGYPVSEGTRWILTAFLYPDSNQSGRPPGYTLQGLST